MSVDEFIGPRNPYQAMSDTECCLCICDCDYLLMGGLFLQVMIVSYDTFRLHSDKFLAEGTCDLLMCDEAHRLKNDAAKTTAARLLLPSLRPSGIQAAAAGRAALFCLLFL